MSRFHISKGLATFLAFGAGAGAGLAAGGHWLSIALAWTVVALAAAGLVFLFGFAVGVLLTIGEDGY